MSGDADGPGQANHGLAWALTICASLSTTLGAGLALLLDARGSKQRAAAATPQQGSKQVRN